MVQNRKHLIIVFVILLALTELAGVAQSDTIYEGILKDVEEARALSGIVYYHHLRRPLERDIVRGEDGELAVIEKPWVQSNSKGYYLYLDEEGVTKKRDYPLEIERTIQQKSDAIKIYEHVIQQLTKEGQANKHTKVPLEMLGFSYPLVGKMFPEQAKLLGHISLSYEQQPSDLLAVAYLELALLKKDNSDEDGYNELIADAIKSLKLLNIHYCCDTSFRACIFDQKYNFARPETCLLFLAGEDARLKGQDTKAQEYYMTLIERAPASPFAWEALAKLEILGAGSIDRMQWLKNILVYTYPLVWGCPRENLKLDKDAFANVLPTLLKKVGEEKSN